MNKQPNVLVIHTDEQALWTIGAYGGMIDTPNIDRLASEGACCDSAFTNSAVCTPSRGCLLTGRYPHCHGAWTNNKTLNSDEVTWAELLRHNGWQTAYIGKWHLDGHRRPGWVVPERGFGFEDTRLMFNRGHWKKIEQIKGIEDPCVHPYQVIGDAESFTTDWLIDRSIERIAAFEQDRPFCLMVSIPDPHTPYFVREPYASMYDPADVPVPESLEENDRPSWVKNTRYSSDELATIRHDRAKYFGMVKCIDDNLGKLFAQLDNTGIMDETLIIFTSDHGQYLGEHALNGKNCMFSSVYNIPLLMRLPETIPAGQRIAQSISTVDMLPTICGLLGIETAKREQGRDASFLLRGGEGYWRDDFHQHHAGGKLVGLINGCWHLVLHAGGDHRLWNRADDPEEMQNLLVDEAEIASQMAERILAHHEDVGSPCAAWLRQVLGSLQSEPAAVS